MDGVRQGRSAHPFTNNKRAIEVEDNENSHLHAHLPDPPFVDRRPVETGFSRTQRQASEGVGDCGCRSRETETGAGNGPKSLNVRRLFDRSAAPMRVRRLRATKEDGKMKGRKKGKCQAGRRDIARLSER